MSDVTSVPQRSRWASFAPWVLTVIAILWGGWGWGRYTVLAIRTSFAAEQTAIFEEMRTDSLVPEGRTSTCDALEYTATYYPSGTKQIAGSQLDKVVECHRQAVTRELIARLRESSEEDLGDDPQAWIDGHCRTR